MICVKLKGYKVSELSFVNKLEKNTQIKFGNKYSYNVRYSDSNICFGELTAEMFADEYPEKFGIKLVINGFFEYDKSLKKEEVHVQSFKALFPYAKSVVSTVSVNAGVPPMFLPEFDIESQSIYKFEKNI